jgi:tetratricopeptide (TPR) repeat protein
MAIQKPHAFMAMPFGIKPGPDGRTPVDFNDLWTRLFKPALEQAGFVAFRADEELRAGDIRVDMFQELLAADLVLVDLTIANPNVWYELGVRHALRERGVVLTYGEMPGVDGPKAFDVYSDRKVRFELAADGRLEAPALDRALARLTEMLAETHKISTRRKVSPVYQLLPHLQPPQWRALMVSQDNEVSQRYNDWLRHLKVSQGLRRPGDIMTLADETPVRSLAVEGHCAAGNALMSLGQPTLALEQYDLALGIDPEHLASQQKRLVCLGRLGRTAEARVEAEALTERHPSDAECWALRGRLEKMEWVSTWRRPVGVDGDAEVQAARSAARDEQALLANAVDAYRRGLLADPRSSYAGINAVTLMALQRELGHPVDDQLLSDAEGAVRIAVDAALAANAGDYWAQATRSELETLRGTPASARAAWKVAVAAARGDWFSLDSSLQTLVQLRQLGFRPDVVQAAWTVVEAAVRQCAPPVVPRRVFLFTGHMMDHKGRPARRFTPAMEDEARQRIAAVLDKAGAGPLDFGYSQAAAGGDLLFLEACRERDVQCQVLLPFDDARFVHESILPSQHGADRKPWPERWQALRPALKRAPRVMEAELGRTPPGVDPFERCNLWLLNSALAHGAERLQFIALWNGEPGDGPGGTDQLKREAERRTGAIDWIDTRDFLA